MYTRNNLSSNENHKRMRSEPMPLGSVVPMHRKTHNEHGWFWTVMHKSCRHH